MNNMNNMNKYYYKYIKYKLKYLNLIGGTRVQDNYRKLIDMHNKQQNPQKTITQNLTIKELVKYFKDFAEKQLNTIKSNKDTYENNKFNYEKILVSFVTNLLNMFIRKYKIPFTLQTWIWKELINKYGKSFSMAVLFIQLRQQLIDNLLDLIFLINDECYDKTSLICKKTASGSIGLNSNIHSDYDLTLTGSYNISSIIQMFNSVIFKVFTNVPLIVFDTNVYGYSFLIPYSLTFNNPIWLLDELSRNKSTDECINKCHYTLFASENNLKQDMWAYKRLFTMIESSTFSNLRLNSSIPIELPKDIYIKQQKYLEQMRYFEHLMKNPINPPITPTKIQTYTEELINALSHMNFYGEDTYFTQGAFLHVVGTLFYYFNKKNYDKIKLVTHQHLIHSMIENLAYLIHEIKIGSMNNLHDDDIVFKTIKYFQRFINAYLLLELKHSKKVILHDLDKRIYENFEFIKNNLRNRSDEEILRLREQIVEFKSKSVKQIKQYYLDLINSNINALLIEYKTDNISTTTMGSNKILQSCLFLLFTMINKLKFSTHLRMEYIDNQYVINL